MTNLLLDPNITGTQIGELIPLLDEYIKQAISHRATWEEDHDTFINSYLTKPDFKYKTDPWPGASNTYLPLTPL